MDLSHQRFMQESSLQAIHRGHIEIENSLLWGTEYVFLVKHDKWHDDSHPALPDLPGDWISPIEGNPNWQDVPSGPCYKVDLDLIKLKSALLYPAGRLPQSLPLVRKITNQSSETAVIHLKPSSLKSVHAIIFCDSGTYLRSQRVSRLHQVFSQISVQQILAMALTV